MDERTNFERHEDNLDLEDEKPTPAEEAQVEGLTVEVEKPPVKANTNLEAPLPAVGTGVHGEDVSTPKPQPQWQAPAAKPAKLGDFVARDVATDIEAQRRGEISKLYDIKPQV